MLMLRSHHESVLLLFTPYFFCPFIPFWLLKEIGCLVHGLISKIIRFIHFFLLLLWIGEILGFSKVLTVSVLELAPFKLGWM